MADDNKGYKSVVRLIEYHGPTAWLEATLGQSRIPIQGALNLKDGVYIKSGIVAWQPDNITEAQVEDSIKVDNRDKTKVPDGTRITVPFKRPGE